MIKKTQTIQKARHLIYETRVMTIAVCQNIPWSAPVYFVFNDHDFYFFSNENSKHIHAAENQNKVAASIFHDSDLIENIFGFQMSGTISEITEKKQYLKIVKVYVDKFNFLKNIFGPQIIENPQFFLERFKSRLYCFQPEKIYLSDNSRPNARRSEIKLKDIIQTRSEIYV